MVTVKLTCQTQGKADGCQDELTKILVSTVLNGQFNATCNKWNQPQCFGRTGDCGEIDKLLSTCIVRSKRTPPRYRDILADSNRTHVRIEHVLYRTQHDKQNPCETTLI